MIPLSADDLKEIKSKHAHKQECETTRLIHRLETAEAVIDRGCQCHSKSADRCEVYMDWIRAKARLIDWIKNKEAVK